MKCEERKERQKKKGKRRRGEMDESQEEVGTKEDRAMYVV